MKPRLLDLFCGAGGAAMGYCRAGFEVVGVDIKPQPHYPFEFHQSDALTYPLEGFDAYHASPPCQKFSIMQHIHKNKDVWPDLIEPIRQRFITTGKPYIIENVPNAPIRKDLFLCGTMFGIRAPKHRIFESNIPMPLLTMTCNHSNAYDCFHGGEDARHEREKLAEMFKIDWFMTRHEIREAIPPAYTEYIGKQLMKVIEAGLTVEETRKLNEVKK
jgi:DNA (cytosine-5)-methyltransferase 1